MRRRAREAKARPLIRGMMAALLPPRRRRQRLLGAASELSKFGSRALLAGWGGAGSVCLRVSGTGRS